MADEDPEGVAFLKTLRAGRADLGTTVIRLRRELAEALAKIEALDRTIRVYAGNPKAALPKDLSPQAAGGIARSLSMSPEERSRQASLAARARWAKATDPVVPVPKTPAKRGRPRKTDKASSP